MSVDIIQSEKNKDKRMKKNEQSLEDLQNTSKHTNMQIMGIKKEREQRERA